MVQVTWFGNNWEVPASYFLKNHIFQEALTVRGGEHIWSFEYNELETFERKHLQPSSVRYASSIYSQPQLLMLQIGS